ncbi:MAG TPA: type II toxin-antitoxin system RelE/ParE family toxin [Spirochaetales bacterium]|nr:type II toxin-antitoxin system RelE/ParE family toxin [Spirochaetales bacterium]
MAYKIEFADCVKQHFKRLSTNQRSLMIDGIEKHLFNEPLKETRNRKPLRPNPIAPWELRIGNLRVFYDITSDKPNIVKILAVGYKKGNTLFIAGKAVKL